MRLSRRTEWQARALAARLDMGSDPDAFGFDVPGREEAWDPIQL